ncbi:hypothetical protein PENTCL1PPCAC_25709, partial [Pristionchus entomophagus]
ELSHSSLCNADHHLSSTASRHSHLRTVGRPQTNAGSRWKIRGRSSFWSEHWRQWLREGDQLRGRAGHFRIWIKRGRADRREVVRPEQPVRRVQAAGSSIWRRCRCGENEVSKPIKHVLLGRPSGPSSSFTWRLICIRQSINQKDEKSIFWR